MNEKNVKKEALASPLAHAVLLRPRITEKAYTANTLNQYVFQVVAKATKRAVKQAVEEVYGVTVEAVNIVKLPGKKRRFGKLIGKRSPVKKAVVTLKKGDAITLFKAGI